jgi:hypothetical protein
VRPRFAVVDGELYAYDEARGCYAPYDRLPPPGAEVLVEPRAGGEVLEELERWGLRPVRGRPRLCGKN